MDVHAVLGDEGTGTTATAVNLAVALRQAGHHAAVLDLTGDVAALLGVPVGNGGPGGGEEGDGDENGDGTDEGVGDDEEEGDENGDVATEGPTATLTAGGTVAAATVDVPLESADREPAPGDGPGTPDDAAADRGDEIDDDSGPDRDRRPVDHLPVIVAGDRSALAAASPDRRESLRADLAFAYDHVIVDAGDADAVDADADDGMIAFADGLLVVTTPDEAGLRAATGIVRSCVRAGGTVVGTVVDRADEGTDAAAVRERTRTAAAGVIPADDRTPDLEPVVARAPESQAATAYRRLAGTVADRSGESGLVDGGPDPDPDREPAPAPEQDTGDGSGSGSDPGDEDVAAPPADDDPARGSDDGNGSGHPLGGDADDGDDGDDEDGGLLSRFL